MGKNTKKENVSKGLPPFVPSPFFPYKVADFLKEFAKDYKTIE